MPYRMTEAEGEAARELATNRLWGPWAPGVASALAAQIERLELIASSFTDPGADWREWRAYDAQGKQIATRRRAGY
jgi:hypothetical protein